MSTITTILATDKIGDSRTVLNANFAALNADKLQINPALGTPTSGVATNLTGTAAGLTVGATTGVEAGADVTDATNVAAAGALMDSEVTNLAQVKAFSSADYATAAQGVLAGSAQQPPSEGAFANGDKTKLDGIEASADVTDATNVTSAGALMDSEVTNLAQVKAFSSADYATASQGTLAAAALPKTGGAMTGAITTNSTFDGRDVATDGTKLDSINVSAITANTAKVTANTTNVTAAGALMDSEVTNLAQVKAFASTDYATAAQGTKADSAQQPPSEGAFINGDKTKLNGIAAGAEVNVNADWNSSSGDSQINNKPTLGTAAATASSDYATAAQGATAGSAMQDLSDDTTPQLGGNLDVNGKDIVSTSNANIDLAANGTGSVVVRGNDTSGKLVLNCEDNSHGVTIKGPPHSAGATYTLTLPNDDGNANGLLQSNGSGVLSFVNSATLTELDVTTLDMAGAIQELVYTANATGTFVLSAGNGTIQNITLTGNVTTVTDSLADGEAITLVVDDGSAKQITWGTSVDKWVGGSAPTLDTTNKNIIVLWKVGSDLYGMTPGVAS